VKRKFRLTHSNDYKRVRHTGRSYAHPLSVIVVGEGQDENPRVGILVSKALGGAVQRNRVKRQLRAIVTNALPLITQKVDIIIIPREPASRASFQEINSAVMILLGRAGLVGANDNDSGR
jgi:ribonuclease P protein component